jgi:hypothetical protein
MADDEWESFLDQQTGKRFYVNHRTRETSWEPPLREVREFHGGMLGSKYAD